MAATKPTVKLQTVGQKTILQPKPTSHVPAVFLVKLKTHAGETTQLCKKLFWMESNTGKVNHSFQPLSPSEIAQIFDKPKGVKIVDGSVVKGSGKIAVNPQENAIGLLQSIAPTSKVLIPVSPTMPTLLVNSPKTMVTANPSTISTPTTATKPATVSLSTMTVSTSPIMLTTKPCLKLSTAMPKAVTVTSPQQTVITSKPTPVITKPDVLPKLIPQPIASKPIKFVLNNDMCTAIQSCNTLSNPVLFKLPSKPVLKSLNPTSRVTNTVTTPSTNKPIAHARAQTTNTTLTSISYTNTGKILPTKQGLNVNSSVSSQDVNLPTNSTVTLRKIPGTDNFVIEQVRNAPSTNVTQKQVTISAGQKIPVGKVLPLPQISTSHLTSSSLSQVLKSTPASVTFCGDPKLKSMQPFDIGTSRINVSNNGQETTASVIKNDLTQKHASTSSVAPVVPCVSILQAAANQVGKHGKTTLGTLEKTSPSSDRCPIPMKITSVLDSGNEFSVSRDADIKSTNDSASTENKTSPPEPSSEKSNIANANNMIQNQRDHADSAKTVSVAEDKVALPALQNVYARIYLAPDSKSDEGDHKTDTMQGTSTEPSLKIDSVFSLSEDQMKEYFPENDNKERTDASGKFESTSRTDPAESISGLSNASSSTGLRDDSSSLSPTVHIKQEPQDSPSNDRTFVAVNNEAVQVKEEPHDNLVQVKEEPTDDYMYTNYPIPNEEEDEGTDTASEASPDKIKQEPVDTQETNSKSTIPSSELSNDITGTASTSNIPTKPAIPVVFKQTPSATPTAKSVAMSSLATGSQFVINGQRLTISGGQSVVKDVDGKKFIVLAAPGNSISGTGNQSQSRPTVPLSQHTPTLPSLSPGGKSYLVTMANGQKRLIHLPNGTPASTLLASLSQGKTVQLPSSVVPTKDTPVPSSKIGHARTTQYEIIRKEKGGIIFKDVKRQTQKPASGVSTNPATATQMINSATKQEDKSLGKERGRQQTFKINTNSVPKLVREESAEDRRRSSRERKHKRRYSPPPIGPVKKQRFNVSNPQPNRDKVPKPQPNRDDAPKPPARPQPNRDEAPQLDPCNNNDSVTSEVSDVVGNDPDPLTPAVASREDRMRLLKDLIREKEAALQEMRKQRQKEVEERENDPDLMDL